MTNKSRDKLLRDFTYPGTCYILRGIPGSGKSTLAGQIKKEIEAKGGIAVICSADDFRMVNGEYVFKANETSSCHKKCHELFSKYSHNIAISVIVDNTHIAWWEIEKYSTPLQLADRRFYLVTVLADPELGISRNLHQVPANTIQNMYAKLQAENSLIPQDIPHFVINR